MTEALKNAGYVTCHTGKWHLNADPTTQGFNVNIGGCHAGNPGSYYPPYKNVPLVTAPSDDYYLTILIMDKVLDFVNSIDELPFFLYYSPYAVHSLQGSANLKTARYSGISRFILKTGIRRLNICFSGHARGRLSGWATGNSFSTSKITTLNYTT